MTQQEIKQRMKSAKQPRVVTESEIHGGLPIGKKVLNYTGDSLYHHLVFGQKKEVNIESALVYARGVDGKTYDNGRYKLAMCNGDDIGIMSRKYTFIANEKVYELVKDAGFKPTNVEFAHNGNVMFLDVFTDKMGKGNHVWSNDGKNGDMVEVGVQIRNSIDGTSAFGGDIFTYRSRCSNGAILGRKDLGTFSVKHVGQYDRLLAVFRAQLNRAFDLSVKVRDFYMKSAEVKMNEAIAQNLLKTALPKQFLPDFVKVIKEKGVAPKVHIEDNSATVWQGFNAITDKTQKAKDNGELGITTWRQYTERANAWLLNTVQPMVAA